jgi:probable phosphoglycerate mutase
MPATTFCIARHGETDWNIAGILQGWIDVPINGQGRAQALDMARAFAADGFNCVCTSPLIRSLETARIIAAELGLPPPLSHDGLKERNFGAVQGIPKAELAELNPALLQQIMRRNPAAEFEQGETMDEFAERVLGAIRDLGRQCGGKRALIITHGWVMDVITREVRGLPRSTVLNMKRKNGECLWVEAGGDSIRLLHDGHP